MKAVYKITYPNGKISVGMDLADKIGDFGCLDSDVIAVDFPAAARGNLNLKKEILWESETASESEARAKQSEYILSLRSYDPAIGYNTTPHVHLPA